MSECKLRRLPRRSLSLRSGRLRQRRSAQLELHRPGRQRNLAVSRRMRKQQVKNFCALLMLANGTPMFCAGDEFMNTQSGNDNPYNVDDPSVG